MDQQFAGKLLQIHPFGQMIPRPHTTWAPKWWFSKGKSPYFKEIYMCQSLNSHYFHIIGDGHQPNSRGLYTHYKDSY